MGYPIGDAIPESWLEDTDVRFHTSVPGLRNTGHEAMLRDDTGGWSLDSEERAQRIHFLKTL